MDDHVKASRTLMGAWIETPLYRVMSLANPGRTLMGAWIETTAAPGRKWSRSVAPLWVRGLKLHKLSGELNTALSHPYGCVD